jgi:DNA-binding PadR family transcriptional regulator
MAQRRPLNATAASLLGFLHDGPLSGYELAATAQRVIGDFWSLTQSQVYRELAWMAEAGLVVPGERGSRDRRPYSLTDTGRAAFSEWIDRPPGPETIRHPLLLTLSFGRHLPPNRLAAFVRQHRELHTERLRTYEQQARAPETATHEDRDPFRTATLAFGIAYERAVMDWFAGLPDSIRDPVQGGRALTPG